MLRIRLGPRRYVGDDELTDGILRRSLIGWDQTMSEDEVALAARGWWRLGERANTEKYAAVVGGGQVRAVMTIHRWYTDGEGRRAFDGQLLQPGHPVRDRFVGQPDPVPTNSRNPVAYLDDPSDLRPCACGCGTQVRTTWVTGHDQATLHRVIGARWGTVLDFVTWCRANGIPVPPPGDGAQTMDIAEAAPDLRPDGSQEELGHRDSPVQEVNR
jgi:hypothetical protein